MDDPAVVAALVSGDPRGLDGAYRSYSAQLYTYCRSLLRDTDAAADAVHDTFVIASQRAGQLRDPHRLRSWLYAIARNECLRLLRARARQLPLEQVGDVSEPLTDPARSVHAEQVRELVWAAAAALNPADQQVFELAVRDDASAADVAAMLGISTDHAHARLSRARSQLERALGALLVARTGAGDCAELAGLLQGWNGALTALLRKRLTRHIDACATCGARQRDQLRPQNLLAAYAALPLLVASTNLWPRTALTCADPAMRRTIAARAGRFDRAGFPRPLPRSGRRGPIIAAAALVLLLLAGAAVVLLPGLDGAGPTAHDLAPQEPAASEAADRASVDPDLGVPSPVPTVSPTGPGDRMTPPPSTGGATRTTPPTPATITAVGRSLCRDGARYLVVAAQADEGRMRAAELFWEGRFTRHRTMTIDATGSRAVIDVGPLLAGRIEWWVEATMTDGARTRTAPVALIDPCA